MESHASRGQDTSALVRRVPLSMPERGDVSYGRITDMDCVTLIR